MGPGIGMETEHIQQALEPFKQLDGGLERRFDGGGLAPLLTSALLRLQDARFTVESALDRRTTVSVISPPEHTIAAQQELRA